MDPLTARVLLVSVGVAGVVALVLAGLAAALRARELELEAPADAAAARSLRAANTALRRENQALRREVAAVGRRSAAPGYPVAAPPGPAWVGVAAAAAVGTAGLWWAFAPLRTLPPPGPDRPPVAVTPPAANAVALPMATLPAARWAATPLPDPTPPVTPHPSSPRPAG